MTNNKVSVEGCAAQLTDDRFSSLLVGAGVDRTPLIETLCLYEYAFEPVPVESLSGEPSEVWQRRGKLFTRSGALASIRRDVASGGGLSFPQDWSGPVAGGGR